ncbi:MAG: DUF1272 domain-containing protein [Flavobacteriaceae bacterium]
MKKNCEHCNSVLKSTDENVMICSYECTYCIDCVTNVLNSICPNCNGNFEKRPIRMLG